MDFVSPLYNTGCNVTADSVVTGKQLVELLLMEKLTYVGTIKGNRPELPKELKPKAGKKLEAKSSVGFWEEDITLVSYIPKKIS